SPTRCAYRQFVGRAAARLMIAPADRRADDGSKSLLGDWYAPFKRGFSPPLTGRKGRFLIIRKTRRDRMMAKLLELKEEMRRRMHWPISEQGEWLKRVVGGFFNYHAVPTNSRALAAFRHHVRVLWGRTLRRRSQKDRTTWDRIAQLAEEWLPKPRILHPWPNVRFAVKHPR